MAFIVSGLFFRQLNTKLIITLKNNSQTLVHCEAFLSEKLSLTYDIDVFETDIVHRFGGPKVCLFDGGFLGPYLSYFQYLVSLSVNYVFTVSLILLRFCQNFLRNLYFAPCCCT